MPLLVLALILFLSSDKAEAQAQVEGTPSLLALWQLIAAGAALPGTAVIGLGAWRLWSWFFQRKDDNTKQNATNSLTYEQQLQAAFLASGARMDENTKWMIAHLKEYLDQAEREKDALDQERRAILDEVSRWKEIARHWYWAWRERGHDLSDARQLSNSLGKQLADAGLLDTAKMPDWPPPEKDLPNLEQPYPKKDQPSGPDNNT